MDSDGDDSEDSDYSVELPSSPAAIGTARHGVRSVLERWHLRQFVDVCQLAVSELVTNAVTHGRAPVWLSLRRRKSEVRLDVQDADPRGPRSEPGRQKDNATAESGRGWDIVQAVSDSSGVEQIPQDGKRVFASWRVPGRHTR